MNLSDLRYLISDMDGVLWRGETAVPHLPTFFQTLDAHHIQFVLATNNASKTPAQYVAKLAKFGIAVQPHQIMTSALATAGYLASHAPHAKIYMVGGDGLREALTAEGLTILPRTERDDTADVVVVGLTAEVTYTDMANATIHIRRGARFIGCNPDATFPSEYGQLPGNGSLLALIQTATSVTPTVIGKPGPIMFHECLRRLGPSATPANTAMLGDRLNTDILGAQGVGLPTILVLSGVDTAVELALSTHQPDFVFNDVAALADAIRNEQGTMNKRPLVNASQ
ncbi:MAG: HAD-IIA family hydrolase [Chloroflexi bacterium]|nr:HAD-IIA family hydrolase [Chloroflexota bacterium]